jgi:PPP family 3-phenylpropionic acid transporter
LVVFFIIGRSLLDRLGPAGAAALAAAAGMVRWSVEAQTAWLPAMAAIQPLHGLTFALLHLANMRPLWMKPGDGVEVEIDGGVGVLRNPIIAEA